VNVQQSKGRLSDCSIGSTAGSTAQSDASRLVDTFLISNMFRRDEFWAIFQAVCEKLSFNGIKTFFEHDVVFVEINNKTQELNLEPFTQQRRYLVLHQCFFRGIQ
jgi:hypothetical protein